MPRTITPEVADVLRRSTITDEAVILPSGQLDRKLYVAIADVLRDYGGKWNRSTQAHVFSSDPREKLAAALANGKSISQQQATGSFYTPMHVVEQMIVHARLEPGMTVLEPSAGDGRIAVVCRDRGCTEIDCIEIDAEKANTLRAIGYRCWSEDFLECRVRLQVDRVLMNPPFAKGLDIAHVSHAFKFLKPGGILVAITSTHWTFAGDKKSLAFRELVDERGAWYELPDSTFADEGTKVKTAMVVLRNSKGETNADA